jgi:hypothetical protein
MYDDLVPAAAECIYVDMIDDRYNVSKSKWLGVLVLIQPGGWTDLGDYIFSISNLANLSVTGDESK